MAVRLPTPPSNHRIPPSCGVAPHRTRTSHQSLAQSKVGLSVSARSVIKQSRKVHSSPDKAAKVIFCHTNVSHTIGKYSTRPYDTTRSNLTGSKSRRAARSAGAAQKSALHRDQRLFAATARIDPVATGLRRSARSIRSGDERDGSRPLDHADQAAAACEVILTASMPLERVECRPASAASHFSSHDCLSHAHKPLHTTKRHDL